MYNLRVLIVSVILSDSLSELPKTFTIGIKLKLRKIKTKKLKMIVKVLILKTCWHNTILYAMWKIPWIYYALFMAFLYNGSFSKWFAGADKKIFLILSMLLYSIKNINNNTKRRKKRWTKCSDQSTTTTVQMLVLLD